MDVSVLATHCETFGLVVIESMANKVPVIATNKCGPMEIIDDGKDGLVFDRSGDDLAKKIELLYNDKELKNKLAKNSYNKVKEKFDKNIQNKKLFNFLKGIL